MGQGIVTRILLWIACISSFCNGAEEVVFLAHRTELRQISLDTPNYTDVVMPIDNIKHVIAVDYDSITGYIYWTEHETPGQAIQRCFVDGSGRETVVKFDVSTPDGIAVDWISQNLYWTDSDKARIEVARVNGSSRKVLIADGLDKPRTLCLDPANGYMYWTDWGTRPMIARAYLDGTHRQEIITTGVTWPNGLTLDLIERRLYWGDAKEDRIESANLDGSDRLVLLSDRVPHIFGLSVLDEYIYWTDWQSRSIERVNKRTGNDRTVIVDKLQNANGLKAAHINRPKNESTGINACGIYNGGCSHLCLAYPADDTTSTTHRCACPTHHTLNDDKHTCSGAEKMLFIARRTDLRQISLDTPDYTDVVMPIDNIKVAVGLDYDSVTGYIYWTDSEGRVIQRCYVDGSGQEIVANVEVSKPEDIAVDWIAQNLYWTNIEPAQIEVSRVNGSSRKVLIADGLEKPRAICLDPANGYMYWTDWGTRPMIARAYLDGTHRQEIITTGVKWPNGLTLDLTERRLYWGDAYEDRIESANPDGSDRKVMPTGNVLHIYGLSVLDEYIYWTDWRSRSVERVNKWTGEDRMSVVGNLPSVNGLKAANINRPKSKSTGTNACGSYNGGCSHLCLAFPADDATNTTHRCACPTNSTLNGDKHTCSDDPPGKGEDVGDETGDGDGNGAAGGKEGDQSAASDIIAVAATKQGRGKGGNSTVGVAILLSVTLMLALAAIVVRRDK